MKLLFDQCVIHNYFFNFQFQFLKLIVVIVWYNKITISPRGRVGGGWGWGSIWPGFFMETMQKLQGGGEVKSQHPSGGRYGSSLESHIA